MNKLTNTLKNKIDRIHGLLLIAVTSLFMPGGVYADDKITIKSEFDDIPDKFDSTSLDKAFDVIKGAGRSIVSGITGVISIALIGVLAYKAFLLARAGDNPNERARITQGIIWYFIGAAILGATSLLTGIFYNMFRTA